MSVCKNENKNSYIFCKMTANKQSFFASGLTIADIKPSLCIPGSLGLK